MENLLFSQVWPAESISEEDLVVAENYACQMHGKFRYSSVEEARLDTFMEKYQSKEMENIF